MKLEQEIQLNKFGQDLVSRDIVLDSFVLMDRAQKKDYLTDLVNLIIQSKATDDDIDTAITESNLKLTFTPCVLLRKGVKKNNLYKIVALPDGESEKVFILFIHLFKVAYKRRFSFEKNNPNKWWYWDLSDAVRVDEIISSKKRL